MGDGVKVWNDLSYLLMGEKGDIGPTGLDGQASDLIIGTVDSGLTASASITGTPPHQILNLVLPKGDPGANGLSGDATGVYNETPSGIRDGINKVFFTSSSYRSRTTRLYKNMLRLTIDGDYVENGGNQITILCTLRDTDVLIMDYEATATQIT